MVRNTASGPTVFSDRGEEVTWAGANDPMGGDLQPVPASFLDSVQFHRMTARGIFVVEEAEAAVATALEQHRRDWTQRLENQRAASTQVIDQVPQNDSVVKTCLGPSGKAPNQLCGADVPIKAKKLAETPPLCSMHSGLAMNFIATESERIIDGKPEVVWRKVSMAAPTRQD
jgi:hypothetical protein